MTAGSKPKLSNGVKRTPSLNDSSYYNTAKKSPKKVTLDTSLNQQQVYENVSARSSTTTITTVVATESMSTQTEAKSPLQMQREDSFVRTGSGRKLPKIPDSKRQTNQEQSNPVRSSSMRASKTSESSLNKDSKAENRKSKPKALQFWESLTNDDDGAEFKYNTIARMSTGRRMLPNTPPDGKSVKRSQSLDRSGEMAAAVASLAKDEEDEEDEINLSDIDVDEKESMNSR